jgi:hypothetical protein
MHLQSFLSIFKTKDWWWWIKIAKTCNLLIAFKLLYNKSCKLTEICTFIYTNTMGMQPLSYEFLWYAYFPTYGCNIYWYINVYIPGIVQEVLTLYLQNDSLPNVQVYQQQNSVLVPENSIKTYWIYQTLNSSLNDWVFVYLTTVFKCTGYGASSDWMIMKDELKRMRKEAVTWPVLKYYTSTIVKGSSKITIFKMDNQWAEIQTLDLWNTKHMSQH